MPSGFSTDGGIQDAELGGRRRRVMEQLRVALRDWPPVSVVQFVQTRDGHDVELVADINTDVLLNGAVPSDDARIGINWWTHPDDIPDQFTFHYSDATGFDCGWHRQPHEDDTINLDHYQERAGANEDYVYEPIDYQETTPVGLLWEILSSRLSDRLRERDAVTDD